ncbi:hypothetical protein U1Q18_047786, partial [Sarracenia purpurea var. burkii]
ESSHSDRGIHPSARKCLLPHLQNASPISKPDAVKRGASPVPVQEISTNPAAKPDAVNRGASPVPVQEIITNPVAKPDAVNRGASPVPVQEIIVQPPEIPSKKKKKKKKKRSAAVKIEAANCNGESSDEGVDVETPVELKEPELKVNQPDVEDITTLPIANQIVSYAQSPSTNRWRCGGGGNALQRRQHFRSRLAFRIAIVLQSIASVIVCVPF